MQITAIETIRTAEAANILWVEVHTDAGLVGLGETFRSAGAVAAYIHEQVAPMLLGSDPLAIDHHSRALVQGYLGYRSSGVEMRAASAIDIALWDILGQAAGMPLYQILGGRSRSRIRAYNTCAGRDYNKSGGRREIAPGQARMPSAGRYDDHEAFVHRADELAHSLLNEGYSGMKIWPFDIFATATSGQDISAADLAVGLQPFAKIRNAVADRIDIMVELHGLWNVPAAAKIARALEPYDPYWLEDPIRMTTAADLAALKRQVKAPICASETLATRAAFAEILDAQAVDIVMIDIGWCGGLSEAKKIAALAELHHRPVTLHDCTGPVALMSSVHLALNLPNALIQETVRAYYHGWYRGVVTALPTLEGGCFHPPDDPGLGTRLADDLKGRKDVDVRRSAC
ncbi:MAG TPA: mandelate racemase/muconate lactonizing enzyme family protein [Alphaproteobacteria bacterium]|nr:mandelate racemase/muconate lactonizing enzyme family protein [Alphaproteobacteria bacterium]